MTGREKVMIALVFAAGCYGFLQLKGLGAEKEKKKEKGADIAHVNAQFSKLNGNVDLSQKEQVVSLVNSQELREENPFLTSRSLEEKDERALVKKESRIDADKFTYSGYFSIGDKTMAIINGDEYQQGDEVSNFPLQVDQIHTDWVKLISNEGWSVKVFYSNKE